MCWCCYFAAGPLLNGEWGFFTQVELGPGGSELLESRTQEDEERKALEKRKYLSLSRRCKEIEQVCVCLYIFQLINGNFSIVLN